MAESIVMAFGTFDLLHEGHLYYLKKAKAFGSQLIVVIARDKTVEELKKRKPLKNQNTRKKIIESLKFVDKAVLGSDYFKDKTKIIKRFNPKIIALGYDQIKSVEKLKKELKENKINVKLKIIPGMKTNTHKSSLLRKKSKKILKLKKNS